MLELFAPYHVRKVGKQECCAVHGMLAFRAGAEVRNRQLRAHQQYSGGAREREDASGGARRCALRWWWHPLVSCAPWPCPSSPFAVPASTHSSHMEGSRPIHSPTLNNTLGSGFLLVTECMWLPHCGTVLPKANQCTVPSMIVPQTEGGSGTEHMRTYPHEVSTDAGGSVSSRR